MRTRRGSEPVCGAGGLKVDIILLDEALAAAIRAAVAPDGRTVVSTSNFLFLLFKNSFDRSNTETIIEHTRNERLS